MRCHIISHTTSHRRTYISQHTSLNTHIISRHTAQRLGGGGSRCGLSVECTINDRSHISLAVTTAVVWRVSNTSRRPERTASPPGIDRPGRNRARQAAAVCLHFWCQKCRDDIESGSAGGARLRESSTGGIQNVRMPRALECRVHFQRDAALSRASNGRLSVTKSTLL